MSDNKDSLTFARLISPVGVEEFFQTHWEQSPLRLSRDVTGFYDDTLSVGDIDRYFQTQHISPHFLGVLKDGEYCPPDQWTEVLHSVRNNASERIVDIKKLLGLFNSGATLIINAAEAAIPSLTGCCRELEREWECHVQANIYITPSQGQGFAPHFDAHNVFILQIHGSKTWSLFDVPFPSPVQTAPVADNYKQREPTKTLELQSGDLLYIPRGTVHSARAGKGPSIHVTVGTMVRHWSTLLRLLANTADKNASFRSLLPHGLSGESEHASFNAAFRQQLQELIAQTDFLKIHNDHFAEKQRADIRGLFSDLLQAGRLTPDSVVCRRPSLRYSVERNDQWLIIRFAGEEIVLPLFLESSMLKMLGATPFKVREIEGNHSDVAKLEMVKRFIGAGFLTIIST